MLSNCLKDWKIRNTYIRTIDSSVLKYWSIACTISD